MTKHCNTTQLSQNLQDCFFSSVQPHVVFSPNKIPKEIVSETGNENRSLLHNKAIAKYHESILNQIATVKQDILQRYREPTPQQNAIASYASHFWRALNLAERNQLIHLHQGLATKRNLPLELQANIGTYLFEEHMERFRHWKHITLLEEEDAWGVFPLFTMKMDYPLQDPNSMMIMLLEHIGTILSEDQLNIKSYAIQDPEKATFYTKYYSPKLKTFVNLPSNQDKRVRILMREYYAV